MIHATDIPILLNNEDPLLVLRELGGYYECRKRADGTRLTPMVAYAGTYDEGKQYVGDVYANFAQAERFPAVMQHYAKSLLNKGDPKILSSIDVFLGAPEGGKSFADKLALLTGKEYCYPEKQVTKLAGEGGREQSDLVFKRHELPPDSRVAIVEDVANNFSTTKKLVQLVNEHCCAVAALVCIFNRSPHVDSEWDCDGKFTIPVFSLVRKPMPEFRQDDPAVAEDIAAGNIIWKPKDEWERLVTAAARARV